jgi:hypothetical protein
VEKLSLSKKTVTSHMVPENPARKLEKFKTREAFRQSEILAENKRLMNAIRRASSDLSSIHKVRKYTLPS